MGSPRHRGDEQSRDLFHANHSRDLLVWSEALRERARIFHLEPGQGAYMPSTSPHMAENGDGPSITMSFIYYTDSTRRDSRLHKLHEHLRRPGYTPAPVRHNDTLDSVLHTGYRTAAGIRDWGRRVAGRPTFPDSAPYAFADTH